jgi:SEC-C motif-containing protein
LKISPNTPCLCNSNKKYKKCCKPFHDGSLPTFAVELMRSRFCAFALNNADYIINTTHSSNHDFTNDKDTWANDIESFCTNTDFRSLDILEVINADEEAYVSFKATLFQDENDISFNEKSRFLKEENKWLYVDGTFFE